MELVFSRSEFLALCALARANNIFGLDAATLLPSQISDRQALYDMGEKSLSARGLLRLNPSGEAELQQDVLRAIRTLADPSGAMLVTKNVPGLGAQRFIYFGRDAHFVEHTQPDEQSHRLGDVGNAGQLRDRLQGVLPLAGVSSAASADQTVSAPLIVAAYDLALKNGIADARDALRDNAALNDATDGWLRTIGALQFSATLALAQIRPNEEVTTRDLAVFTGGGASWLMADLGDGRAQLGGIDASGFGRLLDAVCPGLFEG